MNAKILAIILIAMLAAVGFSGCAAPEDEGEPTPTPEPDADAASIPMPEDTGEGEELPELPL